MGGDNTASGSPAGGQARPPPGTVFALLWEDLANLLGTAATATLLRRSAKRAAASGAELPDLKIAREKLEFQYVVPAHWARDSATGYSELRRLVDELLPILAEVVGPLCVRRLARIPALREQDLIPPLAMSEPTWSV